MNNTLKSIVFAVFASMLVSMAASLSLGGSGNSLGTQDGPGPDVMPDAMNLTMEMKDRIMTMNLTINPNIPPNFPVFAAGKDMTTAWTLSDGGNMFSAYEDRAMGASVIVHMVNQSGQMNKYMSGIFPMDGKMYSFSPFDNALHDTNATDHVMLMDGTMYSMKDEGQAMDDFLCDKPKGQPNGSDRKKRDAYSESYNGKAAYTVDLLMVIDYSIYRQWYSASTAYDRNVDAQNNIVYYFANVAAGMDMRYSTIQNSDFTMRVRLVGIFIAVDQLQSTFTDGWGVRYDWNSNTYTDAYEGLKRIEIWAKDFYTQHGNIFDQATLFTGNFLYDPYSENRYPPRIITGLGSIGQTNNVAGLFNFQNSTIGSSSATINHDGGIYASIQTASHELGHNLGALHDGDPNNCLRDDQYIMANAPGSLTEATFNHPFTFSSCSIQYMSDLLRAITRSNPRNNLLQQSSQLSVTPYNSIQPGQLYKIDQQCKQIYGASSYYCAGGGDRDQTSCSTMACWDATSRDCKTSVSVRAYDGTTCGNRKWCMKGQCVDSYAAPPTTTDTCIYGDYKGPMGFSQPGGNLEVFCSDVASTVHFRCYRDDVASKCCKTCGDLRASSPSNCPYGDKDPKGCQIEPRACYDQNMADSCCSTCSSLRTNTSGCEYGNKAGWCVSYDASQCQTVPGLPSICCQTCSSSSSSSPNQNLIDKATWCPDIDKFPGYCYDKTSIEWCAASCARHQTSNPSCPYGDQITGCTSQSCSNSDRDRCCATCT